MAPDIARSTADAFGVDWGLNLLRSILLSLLGFAAARSGVQSACRVGAW